MILVRYGEIYLKSPPVHRKFQNTLAWNIRGMAKREGVKANVLNQRGRIFVDCPSGQTGSPIKVQSILKRTFGIVSFSPAEVCESNMESITKSISKIKLNPNTSFALRVNRTWKQFPKKSMELERELGKVIQDNTKAKVDLSNPGTKIELEIRSGTSYIFTKRIRGPGGLPLGTGGKCLSLISSPSSYKSTYLIMKRGVIPICAYTDKKYLPIIARLEKFSPNPIEKIKVKDFAAAEKKAKELGLSAIIIPDKKPKTSDLLLLQPLVGL